MKKLTKATCAAIAAAVVTSVPTSASAADAVAVTVTPTTVATAKAAMAGAIIPAANASGVYAKTAPVATPDGLVWQGVNGTAWAWDPAGQKVVMGRGLAVAGSNAQMNRLTA